MLVPRDDPVMAGHRRASPAALPDMADPSAATMVQEPVPESRAPRGQATTLTPSRGHYFAAILDPAGSIIAIDRSGVDAAEWVSAVGSPVWSASCWGDTAAVADRLRDAVAEAARGSLVEMELDIPAGTGCEARSIDLAIHPARDPRGEVTLLIVVARDLSARREAEAELARRNDEFHALYENIHELDALKMQFFANMSHELRTPLALILGSSERLITDIDLSGETRHNAEVVARNARLLLRHVNDLLDVAKLEARKMQVHYEPVNLAELVRHTAEHFDALATERKVSFIVETPETLGAQLDTEKVQRVLLNILSNAFKFTPAGGSIRVLLAETQAGPGEGIVATHRAVLSVLDSGAGVPPDQRETIFERFQQGPVGTTRRFGGTGLGLAIAKDFVELHGGTITVGDAGGRGAAFVVQLPLVISRPASSRAFTPPEPGVAIDMARQTLDELRADPVVQPASIIRTGRVRGVPPGQID